MESSATALTKGVEKRKHKARLGLGLAANSHSLSLTVSGVYTERNVPRIWIFILAGILCGIIIVTQ